MPSVSEREHNTLEFWEKNKIFEKSISQRPETRPYVFYDGPPFATGLPHYGHIVASLMKDIIPRFQTMKGYRVNRVWGWDCHGLPVENIIEEKLQLSSKKEIEEYGIAKFNEECRATVMQYADEWKKTIRRMGRWVDMDHSYMTMDLSYMESVWWVFSELWKKGLIYEGKKAMHVCPRCVTPLSNFEVTLNYKTVKDISATVSFRVTNPEKIREKSLSILAWTTTSWTLPGNVLLAVGEGIEYAIVSVGDERYVIAKERLAAYQEKMKDASFAIERIVKGAELVGLAYEPLFPYFEHTQNAFRVIAADFVTIEDGTGVVHIAPAFGEDDYHIGERERVDLVQHVTMNGVFTPEVTDFAGQEVKQKEDPTRADIEIIKWLAHNGKLFFKEKFEHSYPHCWRCDTPLLNYATGSWFVRVTELREQLLKNNEQTCWIPAHMKEGRFGKWLENARDWAVSRNRFWGAPLPIWKSESGKYICIGSVAELEKLSGKKIDDIHKHIVDDIVIEKDGETYRRTSEVLDCWFESGSMPYGQMHYPFENKTAFEAGFPAEFIAEGQDQTRGWFYTLHVLATALTSGATPSIPTAQSVPAFRNVIVNGIVLAEDGKKMAKRLKNYPDPLEVIEKYGADALRMYFAASPAMHAETVHFSETSVRETYNKIINTLSNVLSFYLLFADGTEAKNTSSHLLDQWILSRAASLVSEVSSELDAYAIADAVRPFTAFVSDLSQWYVRRSRDRFKSDNEDDRHTALQTLRSVLGIVAQTLAPFAPFIAEEIYGAVRSENDAESVHLADWPAVPAYRNEKLEMEMDAARKVVELGHALRAEAKIKVRQPLATLCSQTEISRDMREIIADETNVLEVLVCPPPKGSGWMQKHDGNYSVALQTEISDELKKQGTLRELVRQINDIRKKMELTPKDIVAVYFATDDNELKNIIKEFHNDLARSVLAREIREYSESDMTTVIIDGKDISLGIRR